MGNRDESDPHQGKGGSFLPKPDDYNCRVLLMQTSTALKRLETLSELACAGKPINGLFRLLTCRPLWTEALERIRANKGARTPGVDGTKVTDLDEVHIEDAIQKLTDGSYRPVPVRRVYIPKANGKLRPLGIPTAMDRLVQEVVRAILNRIYEPIFSNDSHGFREGRSCHTALSQIQRTWTGVKWLVEVDVRGFFDNIDHSVLMGLLRQRIEDTAFLDLVSTMLKAGYLDQWTYHETHSGTPQGGIVSPLLANIYLHELDCYMIEEMRRFDRGKKRATNRIYKSLADRIFKAKSRAHQLRDQGQEEDSQRLLSQCKEWRIEMMRLPSGDPLDSNFRRLRYVRYADDFLIGVIGSKAEAKEMMGKVENFLSTKLKLEVSAEKTGVSKATDGVEFLGYYLRSYSAGNHTPTTSVQGGRRVTMRTVAEVMQLSVPRERMQSFAERHRYGHFDLDRPLQRPDLLSCDDAEIVMVYNAEFRGFANYYAMAWDVKTKLSKLEFLWRGSLLKTLANKHKVSVKETMRRLGAGGTYMARCVKGEKVVTARVWKLADLSRKPVIYGSIDLLPDTSGLRYAQNGLVDRVTATECSHCGSTKGPFEQHHFNRMRTIRRNAPYYRVLASARKRKTVTLCEECHDLRHAGRLPDLRIKQMEAESRVR